MANIFIIAEGQTEEQFFKKNLQQHYITSAGHYLHYFQVVVMPSKKNTYARLHKGGSINYENCVANIKRFLHQSAHCELVLLVFDYYGIHASFKDHLDESHLNLVDKIVAIQKRLEQEINNSRFKFRLQIHEFEALLFSDIQAISNHFNKDGVFPVLENILNKFNGNPELINDHPKTAPSKRLAQIFPSFRKTSDGLQIVDKIAMNLLREKCTHFNKMCQLIDDLK
ncbi:MAG: DUF4276 family protein [Saprospiraceae bacterium]